MNLQALREERLKLAKRMRDLCERVEKEYRDFTAEENAQWEHLNREYDRLGELIARQQHLAKLERELFEPAAPAPKPPVAKGAPLPFHRVLPTQALAAWIKFRSGRAISDEEHELCEQYGVRLDARELSFSLLTSAELRQLRVNPASAGGYTVPVDFSGELERALIQNSNIRRVARVIRTDTGAELRWPLADDTASKATIVGEATDVSFTGVGFAHKVFNAYKYGTAVRITSELLEDNAVGLDRELPRILAERLARGTEEHFAVGTGVNQPEGAVTAAHVAVTAAAQNAITADELLELIHKLDPIYRRNAVFMMHESTLLAIRKLKDSTGRYLIEHQRAMDTEFPDTLFGYPVVVNRWFPELAADKKVVLFGDWSRFVIRDVAEVRLIQAAELYAVSDQVAFIMFSRHDSRLIDAGSHPLVSLKTAA
jgi:HK97 family phage major capsid protein